jgi:benzoyl-CoA reductase/2-hydroxyglutaryl-CoA dehydratase subunit BcrC/BadD/HgdB
MKELQYFKDIIKTAENEAVKAWKKGGGKVIGYVCPNVPEEIIIAAGALPYRIRAQESKDASEGDRYMTYLNCSFARHVVDEGLRGRFDFLDGWVGTNACDQIRRVSDIFRLVVFKDDDKGSRKDFFQDYMATPRLIHDDASLQYYREELERLKSGLEKHFKVQITDEKLKAAIKETNESRRLLRKLYDLRKVKNPPISGAEALYITMAYTCMPKGLFCEKLEDLLKALDGRVAVPKYRKRLFLYGSELDDPEWVKVIEDAGGLIVADGLCYGARLFWDPVDEEKEPMAALTERYLRRWSCPRMKDQGRRMETIKEIMRDWGAEGLVGERVIFCQLWSGERKMTNMDAKEAGIPTLWLEREYLLGSVGQMKTRVQAFLESFE